MTVYELINQLNKYPTYALVKFIDNQLNICLPSHINYEIEEEFDEESDMDDIGTCDISTI